MASVKQGTLVAPKGASSWWRHMRKYGKRQHWKNQRAAQRALTKEVKANG